MKLATRVLLVLILALFAAPVAFAADDAHPAAPAEAAKAPSMSGIGAGASMGFAAIGAGIGIGLIGFAALSGIARQPEQAGKIQGVMYVLAALVEGVAVLALALGFVVANK